MIKVSDHKIYWGDLHSHCAISYGEGNLENAIKRASQQLDFCSVTGHVNPSSTSGTWRLHGYTYHNGAEVCSVFCRIS